MPPPRIPSATETDREILKIETKKTDVGVYVGIRFCFSIELELCSDMAGEFHLPDPCLNSDAFS